MSSVAEYRHNAEQIAASSKASDFRSTETSVIYDVYGDEITTISGAKELYYLESDKIPDIVKSAFVLIEDRKFYRHSGIDIAAVVRAGGEKCISYSGRNMGEKDYGDVPCDGAGKKVQQGTDT